MARDLSSVLCPLGLHVLVGGRYGEMQQNLVRNLAEGPTAVVQGVFERY
jgi:hypothetical protein